MEEAYIYDTVRSPRGKGKKGSLNELSAVTLSAKILKELRERNSLNTEEIEDVIWGNVTSWRTGRLFSKIRCYCG